MSIDTLANKEYSRRDFLGLAGKTAGLLSAYPILSTMDSLVGNANAQTYGMPSDNKLKQGMAQSPVDTLRSLSGNVVILDNPNDRNKDTNYDNAVFQYNIPASQRQPVMGLFYSDSDYSRGNATLIKAIKDNYPQINVVGYRTAYGNIVPYDEVERLKRRHGLKKTPAILFYKNDNGNIKYMGDNWQLQGGIITLDFLKRKIDDYHKHIPNNLIK
jgi:hypothetical protein